MGKSIIILFMKNTFSMKEWLMMSELFSLARSDFIEATLADSQADVDFAAAMSEYGKQI